MKLRVALAGAIAGAALFAPASNAQGIIPPECTVLDPCYECVMYPCYPSDWPPFLIDRASSLCSELLSACAS